MNKIKVPDRRRRMRMLLLLLLTTVLWGRTGLAETNRIVGYLPYYRFHLVDRMELDKLTHLVIAFGQPDAQGRVQIPRGDVWPVAEKARASGVKILLSLGGGALEEQDDQFWKTYLRPGSRSVFINSLVQYLQNYRLDGIDVDLEWQYVNEHYSGFVLELERALRPHGKLLTAALPATSRYKHLTDEALAAFDFINIMGYDLTGPFNPGRPGQHAPYSFAVSSINFWKGEGVSAHRLTLGLPMFGWNFARRDSVTSVTYRDLVEMDASFALLDQVGSIYYNGLTMIKAKTELALAEVSGVMLWELGQDAFNELSILRTVHQVMYPRVEAPVLASAAGSQEPLRNRSAVLGGDEPSPDRFHLERRNGRLVILRRRNGQNLMQLTIPDYPPGLHFSARQAYEVLQGR